MHFAVSMAYLLVCILHQLFFFLRGYETLNPLEGTKGENVHFQHNACYWATSETCFLSFRYIWKLLTMIHQSPSFGKLHQHLVCPTDLHTPSPRPCCNKLVPDLLGLVALLLSELKQPMLSLMDQVQEQVRRNVRTARIAQLILFRLGFSWSSGTQGFNSKNNKELKTKIRRQIIRSNFKVHYMTW